MKSLVVSIHAPARGATSRKILTNYHICVSIHAPARGATFLPFASCANGRVSIHAPARGATIVHSMRAASMTRFNPRAREGRDQNADAVSV